MPLRIAFLSLPENLPLLRGLELALLPTLFSGQRSQALIVFLGTLLLQLVAHSRHIEVLRFCANLVVRNFSSNIV